MVARVEMKVGAMANERLHLTKPLVTPLAFARVAPIDLAGKAKR